MKGLRITKNINVIKSDGVWGELGSKRVSRDNKSQIFETNSSFHVEYCTTGKV